MTPTRALIACVLGLLIAVVVAGVASCGPKNFKNTNDDLRRERVELRERVSDLESLVAELRARLGEEARVREGLLGEEALSALPRAGSIGLARLTGFVRGGGLRAYIVPRDGRGRFVQVVGRLSVRASYVPGPDSELTPGLLSEDVLPPSALREAYRDGLSGPAYVVDLGVPELALDEPGSVLIEASFADAITGETHRATKTLELPGALEAFASGG